MSWLEVVGELLVQNLPCIAVLTQKVNLGMYMTMWPSNHSCEEASWLLKVLLLCHHWRGPAHVQTKHMQMIFFVACRCRLCMSNLTSSRYRLVVCP